MAGKREDILHHPSTPAEIDPPSSPLTENQYNPLIGPGTLRRTMTNKSNERAVRPSEIEVLVQKG